MLGRFAALVNSFIHFPSIQPSINLSSKVVAGCLAVSPAFPRKDGAGS